MCTASGTTAHLDSDDQALRAISIASHTYAAYAAGAASTLWLGSSLLPDILCCVRFISMPKPLRACTAGSLFLPAISPPSSKCL